MISPCVLLLEKHELKRSTQSRGGHTEALSRTVSEIIVGTD